MKKFIITILLIFFSGVASAHDIEYFSDMIRGWDDYKEYTVIKNNDEIILKSDKLFKNINGTESYIRIKISKNFFPDGPLNKLMSFSYQKRNVKIGESVLVPAPPQLRIYYKNEFIKIEIRCEDVFDFDPFAEKIVETINDYEVISINGCAGNLQWQFNDNK